ncbi:hypothetical protein WG66_006944 [Moniliophthora roreri]|nr:hypothetical protein WG66_006944 [Moniliophthora roreri]
MPQFSEYELEREANIARNRALLEQLELKQAVEELGLSKPKAPAPKTKVKPIQPNKKVKKEKEVEAPRRQSARLRNVIDPNESPEKKRKREAEIEERRAKEAEERIEAEEKARLAKRPRHDDLELKTLTEDDPDSANSLATQLQNVSQQPRRAGSVNVFAYDDDKRHEREVADLRKKLQNLKVMSRAKVTQDRIYSATYHPEPTKDLIFFGDKHGQLGIWDARAPQDEVDDDDDDEGNSEDREGGKYWRLQVHWPATSKSSISSVKLDPADSHTVFTSSYDCTIRSLSFTTGVSREILSSDDNLITSIDLPPTGHEMWVSDAAGGLTHLDLRQPKSRARWYGLSDQKIGCVSVNPTQPHFLVTSSLSRSMKIWDARKLQTLTPKGKTSSDVPIEFNFETVEKHTESKNGIGCLRAEWRHDKSVSSAYWDPRGRSIVSTCYDDALRIWDFDPVKTFDKTGTFPSSRPLHRIRHDCQTGRWLTVFRAQWNSNPDVYPHFTIGNMQHSLDLYSYKGELITKLSDKSKITAVQAVTCSHPSIVERVLFHPHPHRFVRPFATVHNRHTTRKMGKKKSPSVPETALLLPARSEAQSIVDTHTHLASTFEAYRHKYKDGQYETVFDFVKGMYEGKKVEAIVDVWCEAPVRSLWKEFADSALSEEDRKMKWGGLEYWFVMGVHPHESKNYTDDVEQEILEAMKHPRCVGWGEIGLDYHYDLSPRDVQRTVFTRQLEHAVRLGKPLTIHTREADADTERILKQVVPKDHPIHIHCFTDTPEFAQRLLDHFPNLYIGITGVITYSTNLNTAEAVRQMGPHSLRIVLETDAPYMVPSNIYSSLPSLSGARLPLSHSAMIPWTTDFVSDILNGKAEGGDAASACNSETVLKVGRENARKMYGI